MKIVTPEGVIDDKLALIQLIHSIPQMHTNVTQSCQQLYNCTGVSQKSAPSKWRYYANSFCMVIFIVL